MIAGLGGEREPVTAGDQKGRGTGAARRDGREPPQVRTSASRRTASLARGPRGRGRTRCADGQATGGIAAVEIGRRDRCARRFDIHDDDERHASSRSLRTSRWLSGDQEMRQAAGRDGGQHRGRSCLERAVRHHQAPWPEHAADPARVAGLERIARPVVRAGSHRATRWGPTRSRARWSGARGSEPSAPTTTMSRPTSMAIRLHPGEAATSSRRPPRGARAARRSAPRRRAARRAPRRIPGGSARRSRRWWPGRRTAGSRPDGG